MPLIENLLETTSQSCLVVIARDVVVRSNDGVIKDPVEDLFEESRFSSTGTVGWWHSWINVLRVVFREYCSRRAWIGEARGDPLNMHTNFNSL